MTEEDMRSLMLPDPKSAGLPFSLVLAMIALMHALIVAMLLDLYRDWDSWQWGIISSTVVYAIAGLIAWYQQRPRRHYSTMFRRHTEMPEWVAEEDDSGGATTPPPPVVIRSQTPRIALVVCERSLRAHPPNISRNHAD
jgi:hypothetical protein